MVLKAPNSFRTVNPSRQESLVVNLGLAPIIIINNKEHYIYTWKGSVEQKICFVLSLLTFTDPPLSLVHDHMHKHIGKGKSRVMSLSFLHRPSSAWGMPVGFECLLKSILLRLCLSKMNQYSSLLDLLDWT